MKLIKLGRGYSIILPLASSEGILSAGCLARRNQAADSLIWTQLLNSNQPPIDPSRAWRPQAVTVGRPIS